MNNLFIIGNGFDLAHGLKTSYGDFIKHIVEKCIQNNGCLGDLIKFSSLSSYSIFNYNSFIDAVRDSKGYMINHMCLLMREILVDVALSNWCDVEQKYFELLFSVEKNTSKECYQSVESLNRDFNEIKRELEEYLSLQITANPIESYKCIFNDLGGGSSLVLNFNYTNIVKQLYKEEIKGMDVLHVHGELNDLQNPMVFGYAANDRDNTTLINKNDNEYLRNIKRFAYNRTNNESKLNEYLKEHNNIRVNILGHSIGLSDNLILEQILNHKNIESIRLFFYEEYEHYSNNQINMYRIMNNNANFSKLINYQESIRMPQIDDNAMQIQDLSVFLENIIKEYHRTHVPISAFF